MVVGVSFFDQFVFKNLVFGRDMLFELEGGGEGSIYNFGEKNLGCG